MVPERLALADIADVDLDHRERAAGHGVPEDDRGVGQATGIDDAAIRVGVPLEEVDQRPFMVGLEVDDQMSGPGHLVKARNDLLARSVRTAAEAPGPVPSGLGRLPSGCLKPGGKAREALR